MLTVFYANKVYGQYEKRPKYEDIPSEVYNGAYMHYNKTWFRMDWTPCLDEDVPPALKAWVLLLEGS